MKKKNQIGFTLTEIMIACAIFPLLVVSLYGAFRSIDRTYSLARQFNEMYAVLSACPEIDRALEYDIVSSSNNCYPNNTFYGENGGSAVITYTPTLTVDNTSSLPGSDPLQVIPDSKVINISVGYQSISAPPLKLRMLITRNGIGQL